MQGNLLLMETLVAERLAEARAAAAQERLRRAWQPPRPPLRAVVGARLVELGQRMLGSARATPAQPIAAGQSYLPSGR